VFNLIKKTLPFITAITLSVALWAFFVLWIVSISNGRWDLMSNMVGTFALLVFAVSTTWESIRAYKEWRRRNENSKN
jgi:high-affinity Fe2+/Pb2+ permease